MESDSESDNAPSPVLDQRRRPDPPAPEWSQVMKASVNPRLKGDRLVLAPSVLEGILHSTGSSPLPKVLLFEVSSLVSNTAKVFGSVREFTALSNHVVQVSPSLAFRLNLGSGTEDEMDLDDSNRNVSVRCVSLPKCEYLKIAPLDPEYLEIPDLRALLESHLRQNYSTVLEQDTLVVSVQPSKSSSWKQIKEFRFRITEARPATACSCIDVDINLDVVPLDSNLAEEAVRRKFFGNQVDTEVEPVRELALSPNGSDSFQSAISGAVFAQQYSLFRLKAPSKHLKYNVTLTPIIGDCDLFISTSGLETPNLQDHDYYNVDCGESSVSFAFGGDESTEDVPYVYLSVLGRESSSQFKLSVNLNSPTDPLVIDASAPISTNWDESAPADHSKCPNCFQNVPTRTITMHEAFCVRNNTTCTRCRTSGSASFIFKKSEFEGHWHCDACSHVGNSAADRRKHETFAHAPVQCECGALLELRDVARHRGAVCPERLIVCRFCHLRVRAGPKSLAAKDLMAGLGLCEHESECGSRTIECVKCKANVQLKDVKVHAKFHEVQKQSQKPPALCPNTQCANAPNIQYPNSLGLCQPCFSPYWFPMDPNNQKLATKILGTYHAQLTTGCGRDFCKNTQYCATAKGEAMDATAAALIALEALKQSALFGGVQRASYHLCVADVKSAKRRAAATALEPMGFHISWCVKALQETVDVDEKAITWLLQNAPNLNGK